MTLQAARPAAVALLLAAMLLAAWLAGGGGDTAGVGAQNGKLRTIIEVDGGRSSEMVFEVNLPTEGSYLDPSDEIEIAIPTGFTLPSNNKVDKDKIGFSGSDDGKTLPLKAEADATFDGNTLILTIPPDPAQSSTGDTLEERVGANEHLVITIAANSGITAPETPKGFDDNDDGYPVAITFVDTGQSPAPQSSAKDTNIIVVKNPVSDTVPGATVRVDLATYADAAIGGNEEITVDFSGASEDSNFIVPSTITRTRITIRSAGQKTFSPSDVLVQGARVILTVPEDKTIATGDYTISFSQSARIKNPYSAGNRKIKVSSTAPGDEEDEITAVILRTTTASPAEGPRGSQFTLQGKGYASGTVTVFDGADDEIDPGETLASVKTSRGSFTTKLSARGTPGKPKYKVRTRDSNGAIHFVEFDIRSSMSFEPSTVRIGGRLKVTIVDWEEDEDDPDHEQEVAAVHIGGVQAYAATPLVTTNGCFDYVGLHFADPSSRVVSFEVTVPKGVPPGEQTVAVYDHDELEHYQAGSEQPVTDIQPCDDVGKAKRTDATGGGEYTAKVKKDPEALVEKTVEVEVESLTVTPAAAVRGQRVTISGTGFTRAPSGRNDIAAVSINGIKAPEEEVSGFEVSANGDFAFKVTVPPGAPLGDNEVRVEGWDNTLGQATLEVLGASISLDPEEGKRGTQVKVTGAGFVANGVFLVSYGDGGDAAAGDTHVGSGRADARGNIGFEFDVPLTAAIGRTQKVTVESAWAGGAAVRAEAEHRVPAGRITTTPGRVSPGDRLTVKGESLPAFSIIRSIELEGREVTPTPLPSTDRYGAFEAEVTVPYLESGDLMLRVDVSGLLVTHIVEVGPPPVSGDPADIFRSLLDAGVLVRIWRLEPSEQEWLFYDPREVFLEFNTLKTIDREMVVVLIVSEDSEFRGQPLSAGSNFVFVG